MTILNNSVTFRNNYVNLKRNRIIVKSTVFDGIRYGIGAYYLYVAIDSLRKANDVTEILDYYDLDSDNDDTL